MARYAALLRGVSPMNARMPDLKRAFEAAGFTDVRTVLASGNVVFNARSASVASLQRRAEAATAERLGRAFLTIVRPLDALRELLEADPYRACRVGPGEKRIVTFLRDPPEENIALPVEKDGARLLVRVGQEVFGTYVPGPNGPEFMRLIERTFGKQVTTRTWDTVVKVARG